MHILKITNLQATGGHWNGTTSQLIPVPRIIEVMDILFEFNSTIKIESSLPDEFHYLGELLVVELARRWRLDDAPFIHDGCDAARDDMIPSALKTRIPREQEQLFEKEGYYLEIVGGTFTIIANNPRGIFYGITTLLQLAGTGRAVPACTVLDWPTMEIRGVSDENARGQAGSVEGLKAYCRYIALLKMNTFQMNLEDMFRSEKHPKSSDDERGCYSWDELRELSDYAARYYVEVTPIQSACGHLDNLFYLPEYKHLAEFENVAMCFDIFNPKIYDYISDIVGEEVDAWYLSQSFHMACDESWDVGKGRSRKLTIEKGIGNAYLDHYTRCYNIIKAALEEKHGKNNFRIFIYHDILIHHAEVLKGLPRENLIINIWQYTPREKYPAVDTILKHGLEFIVSPSVMDYQRIFPSLSNSEKNIINIIKHAYLAAQANRKPELFKGQVNTTWGDFRSENERDLRMYGYALSATVSWNVEPWLAFTNKSHQQYSPLQSFKQGFYKQVFWVADESKAMQLDTIVHGIEDGKDFKPWLGYILLFPKLWTHPLQLLKTERSKKYPAAIEMFLKGMALCDELEGASVDHGFYFRAVKLALQLHVMYCKKVLLGNMLRKIDPTKVKPNIQEGVLWHVDELIKEFTTTKELYRQVWEINNKPVCNAFLLNQYDRMAGFYTEIRESITSSKPFSSPCIPSEYIYVDVKHSNDVPVRFLKKFTVATAPVAAHVQVFAINHAALSINGKEIGWVQFRSTLSYMILDKCVKTWEVTGTIKAGENSIDIAISNNTNSWFLLNFFLELRFDDSSVERVLSDSSWVCDTGAGGEAGFIPVKTLGPPPSVVGGLTWPIFENGMRSHFTRFLGWVVEFAPRIPRFLLPLVIALAKRLKIAM